MSRGSGGTRPTRRLGPDLNEQFREKPLHDTEVPDEPLVIEMDLKPITDALLQAMIEINDMMYVKLWIISGGDKRRLETCTHLGSALNELQERRALDQS